MFIVTLSMAPTDLIAFLMVIHQTFTVKIYEYFQHARGDSLYPSQTIPIKKIR